MLLGAGLLYTLGAGYERSKRWKAVSRASRPLSASRPLRAGA